METVKLEPRSPRGHALVKNFGNEWVVVRNMHPWLELTNLDETTNISVHSQADHHFNVIKGDNCNEH